MSPEQQGEADAHSREQPYWDALADDESRMCRSCQWGLTTDCDCRRSLMPDSDLSNNDDGPYSLRGLFDYLGEQEGEAPKRWRAAIADAVPAEGVLAQLREERKALGEFQPRITTALAKFFQVFDAALLGDKPGAPKTKESTE